MKISNETNFRINKTTMRELNQNEVQSVAGGIPTVVSSLPCGAVATALFVISRVIQATQDYPEGEDDEIFNDGFDGG